jgi:phospholipid-binding lipoprotein MlaA
VKWKNASVVEYGSAKKIPQDSEDEFQETEEEDMGKEEATLKDPLEKINRMIFAFNSFLVKNVTGPLVDFYKSITNRFFRNIVSNLGNRLNDPIILLSSVLQLDIKNAGNTLAVFLTNMTVGCFGLFDPAESLFDLHRNNRTIGQTLALYGFDEGFYLVLPFFGPSTLRDGIGLATSFYVDPLAYNSFALGESGGSLTPNYLAVPKYFAQYIDMMDSAITLDTVFIQKSLDPYVFARYSYGSSLHYSINGLKGSRK